MGNITIRTSFKWARLKQVIFSAAKGFSAPLGNFIIAILGIQLFGKGDWGEMVKVLIWGYLIVFIMNWGNKEFLLRLYSKFPQKVIQAFWTNYLSRFILFPISLLTFILFQVDIALLSLVLIWCLFTIQSFDSLVVYNAKFSNQLIAEVVGFIILILGFYLLSDFSIEILLQIYILSFFIKGLILTHSLDLWNHKPKWAFDLKQISQGLPFFLIGFSGWLASRIDIYIVGILLPAELLSVFQLLATSFLMLQAVSALILDPFIKHFYRMPVKSIKNLETTMLFIGVPISVIGSISTYIILEIVLNFNLGYYVYVLGGFSVVPIFIYLPDIYKLYKEGKEKMVMIMNFILAFTHSILVLLLIKDFKILGVMAALCISQYLILIIYKYATHNSMSRV
jgi:O-antigen/teichoic acid export membrane protein